MAVMTTLAEVFGSLGLFFVGIRLVGGHVQQMGGRRFRAAMLVATRRGPLAALLGLAAGAVTQSTNAVTFIVVSMASAGLIPVRRSIPVVAWANVGTAGLVMLATVNVHTAVMALLGVTGALYFSGLDREARFRDLVGAMLGIGLLFLGLHGLKAAAAPVQEFEIAREFVLFAAQSWFLSFLIGALLTLVVQSSATVSIVTVALVGVGLIDGRQATMIIYGAGVGSGLSVYLLGANLTGTAKQVVNLQFVIKLAGAVVLVPLFLVEEVEGVPLVMAWVDGIAATAAGRAAWIFLIYQVVSAVAVSVAKGPVLTLIERFSPPTVQEELARPRFLYDGALAEAESALDLVEREEGRILGLMVETVDNIRQDAAHRDIVHYRILTEATRTLGLEVADFVGAVVASGPGGRTLERCMRIQRRSMLLLDLRETVHDLVAAVDRGEIRDTLEPLTHGVIEALHVTLETLREEIAAPDPAGHDILLSLTADRSDLMDRVRRTLAEGGSLTTPQAQATLHAITALFERALWILRRYAMLLGRPLPSGAPAAADHPT